MSGQAATPGPWLHDAERDDGPRRDVPVRVGPLERQNRELRRAGRVLRRASEYFAQKTEAGPE